MSHRFQFTALVVIFSMAKGSIQNDVSAKVVKERIYVENVSSE